MSVNVLPGARIDYIPLDQQMTPSDLREKVDSIDRRIGEIGQIFPVPAESKASMNEELDSLLQQAEECKAIYEPIRKL
jgi:hypothetical protein